MNDRLSEGTYFLAILQDVLLGANAGFGPWWIWLPLPILHVHVHVQFAAEHGNLRFCQQAGIAVSGHLKKNKFKLVTQIHSSREEVGEGL